MSAHEASANASTRKLAHAAVEAALRELAKLPLKPQADSMLRVLLAFKAMWRDRDPAEFEPSGSTVRHIVEEIFQLRPGGPEFPGTIALRGSQGRPSWLTNDSHRGSWVDYAGPTSPGRRLFEEDDWHKPLKADAADLVAETLGRNNHWPPRDVLAVIALRNEALEPTRTWDELIQLARARFNLSAEDFEKVTSPPVLAAIDPFDGDEWDPSKLAPDLRPLSEVESPAVGSLQQGGRLLEPSPGMVCGVVAEALETYDSDSQRANIESAKAQLAEVLERFPRQAWPEMALEEYALGQPDHPENFCRWMEFRATDLGSMKGGSARKDHIYRKSDGGWWFEDKRYSTVEEAWTAVRSGFLEAISKAEDGQWEAIDAIPALQGGPALLAKTLHVYFPDEVLPICSHAHLSHFLRALGASASTEGLGTIALNRLLLENLRGCIELEGWSTKEIERLLYESSLSPFRTTTDTPIGDVAEFVARVLAEYGEGGIEVRREAEDQARELLDAAAGTMDEQEFRGLLRLFNADSYKGVRYETRFQPAFVGALANALAQNLNIVNEWTQRLWRASDEEARLAIGEFLANRSLFPYAGTSYPTMLLHLKAPETFAFWVQPTDKGLRRLRPSYKPERSPGKGVLGDYLAFCEAAVGLMADYDIPPELLDAVLSAASREEVVEDEEAGPTNSEGAGIWLFQANPDIFDIDRALSQEPEMTWVVRQHANEVSEGDRVYLWRSGTDAGVIATATVVSPPAVMPGEADSPYVLKPESLAKAETRVILRIDAVLPAPIKRAELLEHPLLNDLAVLAFANATNFKVSAAQDEALRTLISGSAALTVPSIRPALSQELHLPQSFLDGIVEMLLDKGQVIFYGPPGTGKTWVALQLAEELTRDGGRFDIVQFHPSYAYEDFIGGFRPQEDGAAEGGVRYKRTPGPLRTMAAAAAEDSGHPYVLVIDEINRGNIPKIFGELLFLLEYRRREVRLQYWPEAPFTLPENLFLIGTMNTADRSIALVDAALRRRFFFVEFSPTAAPVKDVLPQWLESHGLDKEPAAVLDRLNREIGADDFAIGPTYFMNREGSAADLDRIWERAIMPLLHEYYYGTTWDPARFSLASLKKQVSDESTSNADEDEAEPLADATPTPEEPS